MRRKGMVKKIESGMKIKKDTDSDIKQRVVVSKQYRRVDIER